MIAGLLSACVAVAVVAALLHIWVRRLRLTELLDRANALCGRKIAGPLPVRTVRTVEALFERLTAQEHRMQLLHSVTGLPTREPLARRMATDGRGTLALLASKDYDRLCVFDPPLAERVLKTIADRISAMLSPSHFVAQIDRSHLAIWMGPEVALANAEAEVAAVRYALGAAILEDGREIVPEIVSRIVHFDAADASPQSAISQALSTLSLPAMAACMNHGTSAALGHQTREHFDMEQDLRRAIAQNEFGLLYQPLIDAPGKRVCGAEALLRWQHPERGMVQPSTFLPVAEAAGLSQEIGLWALNRASRDARSWLLAGLTDLSVAVNVTGYQLEAHDLSQQIFRTLERHGLPPRALEIELTESVALADDVRATALCDDLRANGVRIAIDDFGTGYSSLGALRNLEFDKIKIDRTFVSNVAERRDSQAICTSVIDLGRGLGIEVLAEGVETANEYLWLRLHGCRLFQGFHFAPPLTNDDFVTFVRNPRAVHALTANDPVREERRRA